MKNRYFLKLSYKGTAYHGWQVQPNAPTVQEILNNDMSLLLREEIRLTGCGRTDTGVHAREFYAHFDTPKSGLAGNADFLHHLNGKLPVDIAVHDVLSVRPEAHARYDAISRTYEYHIMRAKEVFQREYSHYAYGDLDTEAMQRGADILKEYTDFTSFSKADAEVDTHECRIMEARWEVSDRRLDFTITADRFLRNMVRAIVGTLLDVGFGKTGPEELRQIIESRNRSNAGTSAPARGLFLTSVRYPPEIFRTAS